MRRPLLGFAIALGLSLFCPPGGAYAQTGGYNDPFGLYYGWFLPQQAMLAAQPNVNDTLNAVTAARQFQAVTDRAGLYDPISPYGEEEYDPLRPYSARRGGERLARVPGFAAQGMMGGTIRGYNASATLGPATIYYNRTARYFPTMRVGRGPNKNLTVQRNSRFGNGQLGSMAPGSMGGGGMGGMGMPSMPGVR